MADKKDDIVLSIRGMSKSFGRNRVLDHINLNVLLWLWNTVKKPGKAGR